MKEYIYIPVISAAILVIIALVLIVTGVDNIAGMPVLSAGSWAFGYVAGGIFAGGVFAAGVIATGVFAAGVIAIGVFSIGIFSVGIFSIGILNIGIYAIGIYAIGKYAHTHVSPRSFLASSVLQSSKAYCGPFSYW